MKKEASGQFWWWLLLIIVLAGVGLFLYWQVGGKQKQGLVVQTVPSPETTVPSQVPEQPPEEKGKAIPTGAPEKTISQSPSPERYTPAQIEKDVAEFFRYLDQRPYIRRLNPTMDTASRTRALIKELSARPPLPAGEGIDPRMIIQNIYYFYRILSRQDLKLIREVLKNEKDDMEVNLRLFYTWLKNGQGPGSPVGWRPTPEVLYKYAGFFLNTIGGRAYLFRRAPELRLLMSYYCLLIVHEADLMGKNNYGIDIFPYIEPLRQEISQYTHLQFQADYLEQLETMDEYYSKRR
jgi:hypothetical protein